jgi:hypothetical protein
MMNRLFLQKSPKDPSLAPTTCEICGEVKPLREMFSMATVYRMTGYAEDIQVGLPPYQCPDKQHFGCTHEHALLAMLYCLFEHIHEGPHLEHGKEIKHPVLLDVKKRLEEYIQEMKGEIDA